MKSSTRAGSLLESDAHEQIWVAATPSGGAASPRHWVSGPVIVSAVEKGTVSSGSVPIMLTDGGTVLVDEP